MRESLYTAPVDDYRFLYSRAFGLDLIARSTDGALNAEDATDIVQHAGDFAASVLAPLSRIGDTEGARLADGTVQLPDGYAEACREVVEGGWISAEAPAPAGGDGLPDAVRAALSASLSSYTWASMRENRATIKAVDTRVADLLEKEEKAMKGKHHD